MACQVMTSPIKGIGLEVRNEDKLNFFAYWREMKPTWQQYYEQVILLFKTCGGLCRLYKKALSTVLLKLFISMLFWTITIWSPMVGCWWYYDKNRNYWMNCLKICISACDAFPRPLWYTIASSSCITCNEVTSAN